MHIILYNLFLETDTISVFYNSLKYKFNELIILMLHNKFIRKKMTS